VVWIVHTLLRYGPPFAVYLWQRRVQPAPVTRPVPSVLNLPVAAPPALPQTAPSAK
jgi:hypothetical protein